MSVQVLYSRVEKEITAKVEGYSHIAVYRWYSFGLLPFLSLLFSTLLFVTNSIKCNIHWYRRLHSLLLFSLYPISNCKKSYGFQRAKREKKTQMLSRGVSKKRHHIMTCWHTYLHQVYLQVF